MKMRASFGKIAACALAGFCIFSLALIFAIHQDAAVPIQSVTGTSATHSSAHVTSVRASQDEKWVEAYGKLPMGFEQNSGQTDPQVRFLSHGQGYELFLTSHEAVLALETAKLSTGPTNKHALRYDLGHSNAIRVSSLRVGLSGANPIARIAGVDKLPGRTDYFIGNHPQAWTTDVASYRRVEYKDVYQGIDLVFHGNQQQLEYDYLVSAGADPHAIALDVKGARSLAVDRLGNLVMQIPNGRVEWQKPVAYQEVNGEKQLVAVNYSLSANHQIRFALGPYDASKPLTIDPILFYSTYLGGSASGDVAYGVAVDSLGDAFIAGQTLSATFPVTAATAYSPTAPTGIASGSVFLTELNPGGTAELYSTFLGGNGGETGFGVAVDSTGNAYVTGQTFSTNFPVVNPFQSAPATNPNGTAFLSKINPTLTGAASLVYSTYLGGTGGDMARAITVDANQNAYLTGLTFSTDFPLSASPYQAAVATGNTSGTSFLTRIDTTQSGAASLIYSTYLGGDGANAGSVGIGDFGFGVAVDSSSNAYLVGITSSSNFPTQGAFETSVPAGNSTGAVFFSRIDTTKSGAAGLIYSTYLAGSTGEIGYGVTLGPNGIAYLTGQTASSDFPVVPGPAISTPNTISLGVAFLSLVDTSKTGASSLPYSTVFGGNNGDTGYSVKSDSSGNAYITGTTNSYVSSPANNFPTTAGALQTTSTNALGTTFVTEINPGGVNTGTNCSGAACLTYSTLFGGSGNGSVPDRPYGLALDSTNSAYIAGQTGSSNFPVFPNPGAFQTTLTQSDPAATSSAFVAKLVLMPTVTISPLSLNYGTVLIGQSATMTVSITNNTGVAGIPLTLGATAGANAADFAVVPGGAGACGATLPTSNTPCTVSIQFTPTVNGAESASIGLTYAPYGISNTQTVNLTGSGTNVALSVTPSSLTFAGQMITTTSAPQAVTLTNNGTTALNYTATLTDSTGSYAAALSTGSACTATTIPAATTCTYNITFTPTTASSNPVTATFSIAAGGVNNVVNLSGTGWQFTMTPNSLTSSAAPGASPNPAPSFTLTFVGGFPGPVSLACTGSIPLGTCSVPGSVSASGTVNVTLTTKASSMTPPGGMKVPPVSPWQMLFIGLALFSLLAIPFARKRAQKIGLAGALVLMIALSACSGSSGTPAGTYNLTVTGTGSGAGTGNTETQTVTIAFTVT